MKTYTTKLKRSPVDERDWKAEAILKVATPGALDYRPELQEVRSQGGQGSCAAQSGACMKEWQEYKDYELDEHMSPQFIYNNRENQTEGMYTRNLMKILHKIGCVLESKYKYGTLEDIGQDLLDNAKIHVIKSYAAISTIDGLKSALTKNGVCIIAVPVYNYGMRMWKPEDPQAQIKGGHAMTIVGYSDNKKHFIIRNSWGVDWGDSGYCYFPYSDFGMQWEIWTTIDDESGDPDPYYKLKKIWYSISKFLTMVFTLPYLPFTIAALGVVSLVIMSIIKGGVK